jgi:hypothetical protein
MLRRTTGALGQGDGAGWVGQYVCALGRVKTTEARWKKVLEGQIFYHE